MKSQKLPHLKYAKNYWKNFLDKTDIAIDATLGNGFDALYLAKILIDQKKPRGKLICFDIQKKAIDSAKLLLSENLKKEHFKNINILHKSHEDFTIFIKEKINLIVYNLGYLPKSDKKTTTTAKTTISSLESGFKLLAKKAAISIISYSGHTDGKKEEIALIEYLKKIDKNEYSVLLHKWLNKENSPTLFWIEKK
ncbi:MAG: hypothetical protein KR126chlam5_00398 [Candidatus Anoxychlamydiales bacterium]|nr:hypothetical protein [Candidatus Anoxychlamydiales bacterium]